MDAKFCLIKRGSEIGLTPGIKIVNVFVLEDRYTFFNNGSYL